MSGHFHCHIMMDLLYLGWMSLSFIAAAKIFLSPLFCLQKWQRLFLSTKSFLDRDVTNPLWKMILHSSQSRSWAEICWVFPALLLLLGCSSREDQICPVCPHGKHRRNLDLLSWWRWPSLCQEAGSGASQFCGSCRNLPRPYLWECPEVLGLIST